MDLDLSFPNDSYSDRNSSIYNIYTVINKMQVGLKEDQKKEVEKNVLGLV